MLISLLAGFIAALVSSATAPPSAMSGFVTAAGQEFHDASGRRILLHGIAIANKSKEQGYTAGIERSDFASIRSWRMNCVRLAIFWDGIEPQPGVIDREYLDRVARIVSWAKAEGVYVLLDMHQDLYSVKFSDGAPAWATLDEGKPHITGAVWSDSYYASEAVQTSLDHFWANSPAPDGKPLQDHYAAAWRAIAERFRDEPAVLGYDLMNEPFPGHGAGLVMQASMQRLSELLARRPGLKAPNAEELVRMESTPEGRRQITLWLNDLSLFTGMIEGAAPIMQEFDRNRLMPMYDRIRTAIRAVDRNHILFLEPAMSANMGIPSAIRPLADETGRRDPQQAYAPHGYDIVVDTSSQDLNNHERIALIFRRHGEMAARYSMPMLVGEWGAYSPEDRNVEVARFTVGQFDALGCGDTFWAYRRGFGKSPLLPALKRHPLDGQL
jgi:endoglycosylceramidase